MAVHIQDLRIKQVVKVQNKTAAGTVASGIVDMSGARRLALFYAKGDHGAAGRVYLKVGHASASTTDYASSTSLKVLSGASVSTAIQELININWDGKKRYAIVLLSSAVSCRVGVFGLAVENEAVPPSTGFTTVSNIPSNP